MYLTSRYKLPGSRLNNRYHVTLSFEEEHAKCGTLLIERVPPYALVQQGTHECAFNACIHKLDQGLIQLQAIATHTTTHRGFWSPDCHQCMITCCLQYTANTVQAAMQVPTLISERWCRLTRSPPGAIWDHCFPPLPWQRAPCRAQR